MTINYNDYVKLKKEYAKAIKEGKDIFTFKGNELLVNYAKYLIEYLSDIFDRSNLN